MTIFIIVMVALAVVFGVLYLFTYDKQPLSPQDKIRKLQQEKHSSNMNRFAATKEAGAATARAKALTAINEEAAQLTVIEEREAQTLVSTAQNQTEIHRQELEQSLIAAGKQHGLPVEMVGEVNKAKYLSEIKLEENWKMIVQDMNAGDLLETSDHQVIKKLTEHLTEQIRDRYALSQSADPDEVKERLLKRYDKNIEFLEAKIDGKQAGLLSSENGKETLRLAEGETDSAASSSEEAEAT
jgi:hypothetical protein